MTVIAFPGRTPDSNGTWRAAELEQLVALLAVPARAAGTPVHWEVDATERGDPQFYLLGPAPDFECLLCCSRLEARYVLEDGAGALLAAENSLQRAVGKAVRALAPARRAFVARVLVFVATFRVTVEQKLEPMLAETSEWVFRFGPQLAAFA